MTRKKQIKNRVVKFYLKKNFKRIQKTLCSHLPNKHDKPIRKNEDI